MGMEISTAADWRHATDHITAKHMLTPAIADEVLADPNRLVLNPDPSSTSGKSVRVIGYSRAAGTLVTVIVVPEDGVLWDVNAWTSNPTDRNKYHTRRED